MDWNNQLMRDLLIQVRSGDNDARSILVKVLKDNGAMAQLNRYLYKDRLLEPRDVESEFWLGVVEGMNLVREDIGNPIQYLIWRGICQVKRVLRKRILKEVSMCCHECGHIGRLHKVDTRYTCTKCGSREVETVEKCSELTEYIQAPDPVEGIEVEEFKGKLSPTEQKVLDLLLEGHHKEEGHNYLKEIGAKISVSPQRASQCVMAIRRKYTEYMRTR